MRILLTRPAADAARTAAALRARGHAPIVAPLLRIENSPDAEFGAGPWAAILITSANAARAVSAHSRREQLRGVPVFAVGSQSAQDIRAAGFGDVTSADGNVSELAELIATRLTPPARLLYLAGEERAGDLAATLRARNFIVDTVVVYRIAATAKLPAEAAAALAGELDGVLHYSRRSAAALLAAARRAGLLDAALTKPVHYCLSSAVAEPLRQAGAANVRVAARPDEAALLALCG